MAKLMIVDDSSFMRALLTSIVEADHQVVCAESGEELLSKYGEEMPDVVFLDILMPQMNGLDTLRKFMGQYPDAKVVICSSMGGQEEIVKEALALGAKDIISKPFSVPAVMETLEKCLN